MAKIGPNLNGGTRRLSTGMRCRLILRAEFEMEGLAVDEVIQTILQQAAVPT